jgi:hypothetical protein
MYVYLICYTLHKFALNKKSTFRIGRQDFFCFSRARRTFSAILKYRAYKGRNKRTRKTLKS